MADMDTVILTPSQQRALEIYLESATIENDYTPISFVKIAEQLKDEGFTGSSSAIQRWSKRFNFENQLTTRIQLTMIPDKEKSTQEKALNTAVKKQLVDLDRNNRLTADCYEILELFVAQVATNYDNTGIVKREDAKIVKDVAGFTAGREDKMLEILANTGGEKLTSKELLEEHNEIVVEVEDD